MIYLWETAGMLISFGISLFGLGLAYRRWTKVHGGEKSEEKK